MFLCITYVLIINSVYAQQEVGKIEKTKITGRSPFRRGYIRLGISTPGKPLNNDLSPMENVLAGHYGANMGYALDIGHVFYFLNSRYSQTINYGIRLDYYFR